MVLTRVLFKHIPACCPLFFLLFPLATAQEMPSYIQDVEPIFNYGVKQYQRGRHADANEAFHKIIANYPLNQRTTASYVMGGKSLFNLGRYEEAASTLSTFLQEFPESKYVADARYTLGLTYYQLRRYRDAVVEFSASLEYSANPTLTKKLEAAIDDVTSDMTSLGDVRTLLSRVTGIRSTSLLTIKLAEKQYQLRQLTDADETLSTFLEAHPETPYYNSAKQLLSTIQEELAVKLRTSKIGVLLPLHTAARESEQTIGNEILEGVQCAFDEYQANPALKLALAIRDSKGDAGGAAVVMREFARDKSVLAVVGPVFSPEVIAAAKIADGSGIPLISPTATSNGIAAIGSCIFQTNPDYSTRGKAMAQHAIQKLETKTVAVLAPSDMYGKSMAESFVGEAERLGATVIAQAWYKSGAMDLSAQCKEIREAIFRKGEEPYISFAGMVSAVDIEKLEVYGTPKVLIDSLLTARSEISIYALFGRRAKRIADSLGLRTVKKRAASALDVGAWSLDALYCPIASNSEIGVVLSQLAYSNIKTQILGSGDWDNRLELDRNSRYASGVIFESDSYVDDNDAGYRSFCNDFTQKTGKKPTKNALFGYDTMRLLLQVIAEGASSREQLKDALSQVRGFHGYHANISLDAGRINSELHILQYKKGQITRLDDVRVE